MTDRDELEQLILSVLQGGFVMDGYTFDGCATDGGVCRLDDKNCMCRAQAAKIIEAIGEKATP